jgi:hypothetical protein
MIRKYAFIASTSLAVLAGCGGSGDIEINPTTVDNSVSNSNNTTTTTAPQQTVNPCATYTTSGGQTRQGTYGDDGNCTYSPAFADSGNNITVDIDFAALPNGGAHIFEGSLFIGEAYSSTAEMNAAGIFEGGDGPTMTVEAGATLAWQSNDKFMVINRGSQLVAIGTASAPITFTSVSDVNGTVGPEDDQQWGGMVIDGFGVSNKCVYTGTRGVDLALVGECDVASEGSAGSDENYYGGANDDDSSGRLDYVIVKHTGATVGNGDELNGITFGAVGRGTTVTNLQVYSVFDDGIEMFGGAVNVTNYAAIYVNDDSIDLDEGWSGTVRNALVVQSETDGNHCVEADGIGSYSSKDAAFRADMVARGLNTQANLVNLTCIVSPNGAATATHDPGAGLRLREGITANLTDVLVVSSFIADDPDSNNYCFRPQDAETSVTINGIFACETNFASDGEAVAAQAGNDVQFATLAGATDPTANADTGLILLEGTTPVFSVAFANMVIDDAAPTVAAPAGDQYGAVSQAVTNPFAGWTYGIFDGNRAQPLYFE